MSYFYSYCEKNFWFHSFTCSCSVCSKPTYWRICSPPPLYILASFVIDWLIIGAWVYFGSILSHLSTSVFAPVPYNFGLLRLCSIFSYQRVEYFQLCSFFLKIASAVEVFCGSIQILGLCFLVLWKMSWVIWWGLHWICRLLWVYGYFSNINSSSPWTWDTFLFICIVLNHFHQIL